MIYLLVLLQNRRTIFCHFAFIPAISLTTAINICPDIGIRMSDYFESSQNPTKLKNLNSP